MIESCRGDGVRDSREMMEDDEGVNFKSGRSFISIGLPTCTLVVIRLTSDIPVGLAWREAETILVLAAEDRCGAASDRMNRICRGTGGHEWKVWCAHCG